MDKHQKTHHSFHHTNHKKCHVCSQQTDLDCQLTEMAQYSKQTGNLIMIPRLACLPCRQQIQSVRYYVENNGLNFGKCSKIYHENIQPFYPFKASLKIQQENSLYQKNIEQEIKRSKIYHEGSLPQNCLQLVYYCSFGISQGERHEKIRNTIKRVMSLTPINYANLSDISILVHCLTCFMGENNVVDLLKYIMDTILVIGSPFKEEVDADYEMPFEPLWRELSEQVHIGNLIVAISLLVRSWQTFPQNLKILKQKNHIVQFSTIKQLFKIKEQQPSKIVPIQKTLDSCPKCSKSIFPYLKAIAQQKNMMTMLLKTVIKEQDSLNQHIKQLEEKHTKQKEEYINKIIKLKDKIQILEKNQYDHSLPENATEYQEEKLGVKTLNQNGKRKRSRSITEDKLGLRKKYTMTQDKTIVEVQQTSEVGSHRILQQHRVFDQNGNQTQPSNENQSKETKIEGITEDSLRKSLQKMLMIAPEFDPSLLDQQTKLQIMLAKIEEEMNLMQEKIESSEKKIRILEQQSKRVLGILTRKEERFIPLIHQKDQIIEKYEHALWRMENFMPVDDEHLGPRIQTIINKYKQQFMETLTVGTNIDPNQDFTFNDDSFIQSNTKKQIPGSKSAQKNQIQSPDKTPANKKQTKTQKKKIKKKTKSKSSEQQKQCVIF